MILKKKDSGENLYLQIYFQQEQNIISSTEKQQRKKAMTFDSYIKLMT